MKHTRTLMLAFFLVLALAAAACGGDDGTETDSGSSEATSSEPADSGSSEATSSEDSSSAETAELDTTCQVELPEDGPGSADGMAQEPVATAASNNPELSTLVTAVQEAGLVDTLNNLDAATVFAPSNAAFEKIPADQLDAVLADKDLLTQILTLHVIPGEQLDAQALVDAGTEPTVNGEDITLSNEGGALEVNGQAMSICSNVETANATVHIIDSVLMPSETGSSDSSSDSSSDEPTEESSEG